MELYTGGTYTGILFFAVAAIICAISLAHVIACMLDNYVLRYATKPVLMPALILLHLVMCGTAHPFVIAALVFGWLGDVFLMLANKSKAFFMLGMAAFLLGHISYVASAISAGLPASALARPHAAPALAAICVFMLAGCCGVYAFLYKSIFKKLRIPCAVYVAAIGGMACTMLCGFFGRRDIASAYTAVGGVLFIISDFLLACRMFRKTKRRSSTVNAAVMATYILAQLCISLGFASL